jgi:hypothetical protein
MLDVMQDAVTCLLYLTMGLGLGSVMVGMVLAMDLLMGAYARIKERLNDHT